MSRAAIGKREAFLWAGLLAVALAVAAATLEQPRPLLLNLGAGDAPYARGFRADWERDGLQGSGETMFHWTQDGARLEFPVGVRGGRLEARLRIARFAATAAEITLLAGGKPVDHWIQQPRGWQVRSVDLGAYRGALVFQFRSESQDGLGVALDWVEVRGARALAPRPPLLRALALLLLGVPLLLAVPFGPRGALASATGLLVAAALAFRLDRLGGLLALAASAGPALIATALFVLVALGLRWAWKDAPLERAALAVPAAALLVAIVALSHPFYYYPDVDTHARFTNAVRADPFLAWDATEYQMRTGAWTRTLGGTKVRFPYSPAFHVIAIPLVGPLGDVAAVKTLAVLALSLTLLLVHVLARALGLPRAAAILAQAFAALLPVSASRLTLALFPTLFGQALELLLVVHLVRRFPALSGARDAAAACAFLLLAQAGYTGSIFNVAAFVLLFAAGELLAGDQRAALRLAGAWAVAALVVATVQYGRFLPVLLRDVLPSLREAGSVDHGPGSGWRDGLRRLEQFYDVLPLALLPLGLWALRGAPRHARRLVAALLLAGVALLALRYALPGLFRDAKEIELLATPVALVAAAGLAWLYVRGRLARLAAILATLAWLNWGALAAKTAYSARFLALGR
jgi:hypothetical protein